MLVRWLIFGLFLCWLTPLFAETIQLKDKASINAKILVEKRDQVVVDLGYTVLSIPRNAISKILKEEPLTAKASPADAKTLVQVKTVSSGESEMYESASSSGSDKSVRELVSDFGEAVVQVRTPGGLGSGFFVNEEGHLITNFHVIEGETQISVEVYHQRNQQLERTIYKKVRILAMNKFQDLALLKIEDKDRSNFIKVPLGDSDALAVGEKVFAIGSPLGLERTVTEGIISTKTRHMQGQLYLQTTTQINPGNSGGPLFNLRGEVVGVTSMKIFGEGIGFAIPVEAVKFFLKHRDAFAYDNDHPSNAYHYLEPPTRLQKVKGDELVKESE